MGHVVPKSLERLVWHTPLEGMPPWKAHGVRAARLLLVLARDLLSGDLTLRAMSLVYTTLLSIVPLLALSFSVLKAFGVHNQIEPALRSFLAPLGAEADQITQRVIGFIQHMNVGVLGSVGLALLLYTAISLVQKLEEAFNHIWHVTQPRRLGERFSRYLSVLLVGPILVFAALGITATFTNLDVVKTVLAIEPFGRAAYAVGRLMPYALVIAAFTFIYSFIPNTRVRLDAALAGGVVGGILWQSAGFAFALFVASATTYSAIYSSFAILILFMIWLYVSWLILLFGASVAFYRQHPEYLVAMGGEPRLSNRMRERVALAAVSLITDHYLAAKPAWSARALSRHLGVPLHTVEALLQTLRDAGMLAESADDPPGWVPARDLHGVSVAHLLRTVRQADEDRYLAPVEVPVPTSVEQALARVERGIDQSLEDLSVVDLVGVEAHPAGSSSRPT